LFTPGLLNILNVLENHIGESGEIGGVLGGLFHSFSFVKLFNVYMYNIAIKMALVNPYLCKFTFTKRSRALNLRK